jgi:hypothetical protein
MKSGRRAWVGVPGLDLRQKAHQAPSPHSQQTKEHIPKISTNSIAIFISSSLSRRVLIPHSQNIYKDFCIASQKEKQKEKAF